MDIPSLFMIPSAVSSGKVHSVFPNSTDADFDFNRDSDATRVNSEGLIERVGYYGSELITNGGFATNSDWVVPTGWSINNGKAIANFSGGATGRLSQTGISFVQNKTYKVVFTISDYEQGSIRIEFRQGGGNTVSANYSGNGTYTLYQVAAQNHTQLSIRGLGDAVLKVDNVSVKELIGDRARLNYEIEGGLVNTKPSLLLEPQSTNLITYSEDYSQSDWVKSKSGSNSSIPIVTDNYAISPDGTTNASRIQFDCGSTSSSDYVMINQNISLDGSSTYALSFYIKSNSSENQSLLFFTQSSFGASITATSEWQRVETTLTSNTTNARGFGLVARGSIQQEVDILIYGGQLEQQSYSTSLIPTNGSSQTRAAETCNGAGTSSIFESSEGILYAEIAALANDLSFRVLSINDGSTSNNVGIGYRNNSNVIYTFVQSVINSSSAVSVSDIKQYNKVAVRFKSGDFSMYVNGTEVYTSSSSFTLSGINTLAFDNGAGAADFYGKIRDIRVYNTKEMTDSEVDILLTKITS
jgi:hypothetical protein